MHRNNLRKVMLCQDVQPDPPSAQATQARACAFWHRPATRPCARHGPLGLGGPAVAGLFFRSAVPASSCSVFFFEKRPRCFLFGMPCTSPRVPWYALPVPALLEAEDREMQRNQQLVGGEADQRHPRSPQRQLCSCCVAAPGPDVSGNMGLAGTPQAHLLALRCPAESQGQAGRDS
jgi:hypothetical protein